MKKFEVIVTLQPQQVDHNEFIPVTPRIDIHGVEFQIGDKVKLTITAEKI